MYPATVHTIPITVGFRPVAWNSYGSTEVLFCVASVVGTRTTGTC